MQSREHCPTLTMADDWLTTAVDGISLENGLDTSAAGESPSLANNISQLLHSTRRDRADLEARLSQLRGFIQQTDEVMRGIVESGDPTLAAKYTHLAGTRRGLEQNAAHLQELLQKVTESEARATQLAERGRQLAEQDTGDAAAGERQPADAARAVAAAFEWPETEQKVAVVRGRPGHGGRRRDAGDGAAQDWAGPPVPRGRPRPAPLDDGCDDAPSMAGAAGSGPPVDRLLRALRGANGRPAASPGGSSLGGADVTLRDKAAELDATRRKLQHLRRLMAAVQEARGPGPGLVADSAPVELRALIGEVESALDGAEEEPPERGRAARHCDDCRGAATNGLRHPSRPADRLSPSGELPPHMAPLPPRRAGSATLAQPLPAANRERERASLPPTATGGATPGRESSLGDEDVRAQLQQVAAMVQSLARPPWPPHPQPAPVWPLYAPPQPPPPPPPPPPPQQQQTAFSPAAGWPLAAASTDAQHQQTLSALSQVFQLLQSQQQQIQGIQRQVQSTAAAVAAQHTPLPPSFPQVGAPLLRVDDAPAIQLSDGFAPAAAVGASMLNNQVAPGSRANNYWDNFRSYSRQNLLSGGSEPEAERLRGDSESFDDARAEGFMARPRVKKQKVNKENQQLERSLSNSMSNTTRPGGAGAAAAAVEPVRPRVQRASTPHNNPQVDAIYSCVTTLIAQNQEQPEFLIELLHDLQLVRSERQRQQVLLAVQSVVVQEVSGARHKQRNRGAPSVAIAAPSVSAAPVAPGGGHHSLLTAEREEAKTSSHHVLSSKHMKNWSHSQQRPEPEPAAADPEDTTVARNLAPLKNAAAKNTVKPAPLEPCAAPPVAAAPLPLEDPELQVARALHEMNVFLSDHQQALLSPVLLARLERLLLRTCGQARAAPPPPGLNRLLEEAMVPFMGQPVSEAGGRLVQAVLERLGVALRGRELIASPPASAPPAHVHPLDTDSEEEEEAGRGTDRADRTDTPGELDTTDEGPQVIPEQEVPSLNGREPERPAAAGAAICRPTLQTPPHHTPEPAPDLLMQDGTEPADMDA